jgi:hypothetical protein
LLRRLSASRSSLEVRKKHYYFDDSPSSVKTLNAEPRTPHLIFGPRDSLYFHAHQGMKRIERWASFHFKIIRAPCRLR